MKIYLFALLLFLQSITCFAGKEEEEAARKIQRAWRSYSQTIKEISEGARERSCLPVIPEERPVDQRKDREVGYADVAAGSLVSELKSDDSSLGDSAAPEGASDEVTAGMSFDPDQFYRGIEGDPKVNCLSYALNLKREVPLSFGEFFESRLTQESKRDLLLTRLNELFPSSGEPFAKKVMHQQENLNYHCVGFFMSHSTNEEDGCLSDLHFVRQDKDGSWSHKLGKSKPTQLDADGKLIRDLDSAHLRYEFTENPGELFVDYHLIDRVFVRD